MSQLTELLALGDLRSDGFANEVVQIVSGDLRRLPELMGALKSENPSVRGHASDALEKLARSYPAEVAPFLRPIASQALSDRVAMVRWHLGMVLSHLSVIPGTIPQVSQALVELVQDRSAFVRSWAITGLALIALRQPSHTASAIRAISPLCADPSAAVAKRARTAMRALTDPSYPLPSSWSKVRVR